MEGSSDAKGTVCSTVIETGMYSAGTIWTSVLAGEYRDNFTHIILDVRAAISG
jgi:hypothetical protein